MTRYTLVVGTDTGVGKTVATAALAAWHGAAHRRVAVIKPVQTGVQPAASGDADEVARLTGCEQVHELVQLGEPLAPESAARRAGITLPTVEELAARTAAAATDADVVLVEGSGGVVVRLDSVGGTVLDLGQALRQHTASTVDALLVVRAGLGTLNHTELSLAAVRSSGLPVLGLVIGCWPRQPGATERANAEDLPRLTGLPLIAALPEGAGRLRPDEFRRAAADWFVAG